MKMSQNLKSLIGIALKVICVIGCLILLGTAFATYTVWTQNKPMETEQVRQFDFINITEDSKLDIEVTDEKDDTERADYDDLESWVVLLTVDDEELSVFQNWFWNFKQLHLRVPVIVIAEDDASFTMLSELFKDNTLVTVIRNGNNDSDPLVFDRSPAFNRLLRERHSHIAEQLRFGKNVLFCGVDSVWLHDPFPYFTGDFDIWAQYDDCQIREGFIAIKSNNKTIDFVSEWTYYLVVQHLSAGDEADIRVMANNQHDLDLRLKTLDSDKFAAVDQYFYHDGEQRSNAVVVVVQSNGIQDYE